MKLPGVKRLNRGKTGARLIRMAKLMLAGILRYGFKIHTRLEFNCGYVRGVLYDHFAGGFQDDAIIARANLHWWNQNDDNAYIYYGKNHSSLIKPLLIVEGIDLENNISVAMLFGFLDKQNLAFNLYEQGYDLVLIDFRQSTGDLKNSAAGLIDIVEKVNTTKTGAEPLVILGLSLGGLIVRYALTWMEYHKRNHQTRLIISCDTPHQGANIPIGIQHLTDYFAAEITGMAEKKAWMATVASRQILYLQTMDQSLKDQFFTELKSLGDYPGQAGLRKIALSFGSGCGKKQSKRNDAYVPMDPGAKILGVKHKSASAEVWAVAQGQNRAVFQGQRPGAADIHQVALNVLHNYDTAPGSYLREDLISLASIAAVFKRKRIECPYYCFVPTVSALDVKDTDWDASLKDDPDLMAKTPFDAIWYGPDNLFHMVDLSEAMARFIFGQIHYRPELLEPKGTGSSAG